MIAIPLFMLLLTACAAASPQLSDGDVVFCLSDAERAALAQAAVTLGLADAGQSPEEVTVSGQPLTVSKWRVEHPEAFTRACSALRPNRPTATPTAPPSVLTWLFTLVTAVIAAVLGFGSAYLQQKSTRAGQSARSLRSAVAAFLASTRMYAGDWENGGPEQPSDLAVQDRRAQLMVELRAIATEYPDSLAHAAVVRLTTTLSEHTFRRWPAQDHDQVATELGKLEEDAFALAALIERPWRNRGKLRVKAADAQGDAS